MDINSFLCPDCDERLAFAFVDTSGVGAWKLGDGFNTTPDTSHYVCFPCAKAWKQRLDGPLTPDIVGDLAFFSCRQPDCGLPLRVAIDGPTVSDIRLACSNHHRYAVTGGADGGLVLQELS